MYMLYIHHVHVIYISTCTCSTTYIHFVHTYICTCTGFTYDLVRTNICKENKKLNSSSRM